MNYEDDIFSDFNRTFLNDTYNDENGENENDSFSDVMDLRSNLTNNDSTEEEDFEEANIDGDEEDENYQTTINSNSSEIRSELVQTTTNRIHQTTNSPYDYTSIKPLYRNNLNTADQAIKNKLKRSKRQCRHNRRFNNRRFNNKRDRANRSNKRSHYHFDNYKESPPFNDDKKWELIEQERKKKG